MWRKLLLLLFLFLLFSAPGFSQDQSSAQATKQQAIAWSLELEMLLNRINSQIKKSAMSVETSEKQIGDEMQKEKQHTDESEQSYDKQEKTSQEQEQTQSDLSSSFEQYADILRASRSETETWVWVSGAVLVGGVTGAAIAGHDSASAAAGSAIGAASLGVLTWAIREGGHFFGWW